MPDFFLISGLFLPVVIDRDWRTDLYRKGVHFAYFYLLWVTIQFGFKAPAFAAETSWLTPAISTWNPSSSLSAPCGSSTCCRVLRGHQGTRRLPPLPIWGLSSVLEMAHFSTGWTVIDEFCARFVYFYTGYLFAERVRAADRGELRPALALAGVALWALVNGGLVKSRLAANGRWSRSALGLAGAGAIIRPGTLLALVPMLDFPALFRRAFHRHLSGVLLADGCDTALSC